MVLWFAIALPAPAFCAPMLTNATLTISQLAPKIAPVSTTPDTIADALPAATLFEQNCAGCHANGGNIIRRGKNLKQRAMVRNGYGEVEAIANIITHGKGIMSAYGERLNADEISAIAQYVHEKSESGW